MTFTIELPYPSPVLSPNARAHWRKVNIAKQEQKNMAKYAMIDAINKAGSWHGAFRAAHLTMTFYPPDKRRRDGDNAYSSCKAMRDGIALALGIDDSKFTTAHSMTEPVRGGKVVVMVEAK